MQTSLRGIANKANANPKYRFRNLSGMLSEENLIWSWQFLKKRAAPGVDRIDHAEYQENLRENVTDLVGRLKRDSYKAKLVRRKWIPKGKDKRRPLGIPATEDKLLQTAVTKILESIYEEDFLDCSYGYRPRRGALDAVKKMTSELQFGKYSYVVEADIKGFFNNIDHEWMIKMLEERIDDKPFLKLIRKWLKAGILEEDGEVLRPEAGSPQGGSVSPILSNIYLHYVLDLWVENVVKKRCRGSVKLIRYCDDFVCAFQYKEDAERFYKELGIRLEKFNLELAKEKTRILRFSRFDMERSEAFDFLSFEFRWGKDRKGKSRVQRRTSRNKFRASIANFTDWVKKNRHMRLNRLIKILNSKYRGYWNYYGIIGNYKSLSEFYFVTRGILFKWLNRRSQCRSYTWKGFHQMWAQMKVETPRIVQKRTPVKRM